MKTILRLWLWWLSTCLPVCESRTHVWHVIVRDTDGTGYWHCRNCWCIWDPDLVHM